MLKDAVAFMSANSTVDFVVCQQEFVGKIVFSKVQFLDSGLWSVTVQTGCSRRSLTAQSIHLREKSIAGPTENASRVGKPFLLASGVTAFISRFTLDVGRAPKCLHFVLARIRHLGLPPTQKALAFLARKEGLAFFDEDDVCGGVWCSHSLSELQRIVQKPQLTL